MADVDFSEEESAFEWFETQSVEMRCVMTSRAALRVLPYVSRVDGSLRKRLALSAMWAILSSSTRGSGRPSDLDLSESAASSAARSAFAARTASTSSSTSPAALSAISAAARSASSALSARSAARSAASAAARSAASVLSTARSAVSLDSRFSPDELLRRHVWGDAAVPDVIREAHADFLTYLNSGRDWEFFRGWYQQMWEGTFRDWDLATEIATLPDDLWEGEEALAKVAEAIRVIEARRLVASTIADHNASVERVAKDDFIPDRGHNNPPELIEDTDLANRSAIVWSAIDALQSETESETPDKHVVRKALSTIAGWIADVLIYVGRKLDLSVDQVIKWGVPLGGTYLVTHPAKLQAIVEAGQAWLTLLP